MKSFAGLAGYLSSVQIDWETAGLVTLAAAVGGLIGVRLTGMANPDSLRMAFGLVRAADGRSGARAGWPVSSPSPASASRVVRSGSEPGSCRDRRDDSVALFVIPLRVF